MVVSALDKAWERRSSLRRKLAAENTDAYRLFTGAGEGVAGLVVDIYGGVAVLQDHEGRSALNEGQWREAADWCLRRAAVRSVYRKRFLVDRSQSLASEEHYAPTPFAGEATEPRVTIREHGVAYAIEPYGGFSTGLFLDQRDNRAYLASLVGPGKKVLNTFSYTCGFSVAAARAGAHCTSVDLSKKWLQWGRDNFALNALDGTAHAFYAEDAFLYFKRAAKRETRFDLIIVDPPSFARGKAGTFSVKKDWERLVTAAAPLVAPGGRLFLSTNYAEWNGAVVEKKTTESLRAIGRYQRESLPAVPEDFRQQASLLACCLFKAL